MIIVLRQHVSEAQTQAVIAALHGIGVRERLIHSGPRVLLATQGEPPEADWERIEADPAVEMIIPTSKPGGQQAAAAATAPFGLRPGGPPIGGLGVAVIAGPCSVEDRQQVLETAAAVAEMGAIGLRGGAYKPRTNPYSFQGLGERGLALLAEARERTGLAVVTEVMAPEQADLVAGYADVLQIGTRNMHNFDLLAAAGRTGKPVLLKRGWSATLDEWLHAAEYIIAEGNAQVILCERGIRTFEQYVRNTLALAVVPAVKLRSPLPVIVDPSQGTGVAALVGPMSRAALACGADGLLIEVHPNPAAAVTDGDQSLNFAQFKQLMGELRDLAPAVGRSLLQGPSGAL